MGHTPSSWPRRCEVGGVGGPSPSIYTDSNARHSYRLSAGTAQARIAALHSIAVTRPIPSRYPQIARSHRPMRPSFAASWRATDDASRGPQGRRPRAFEAAATFCNSCCLAAFFANILLTLPLWSKTALSDRSFVDPLEIRRPFLGLKMDGIGASNELHAEPGPN